MLNRDKQTKEIYKSAFTKKAKTKKQDEEYEAMRNHFWYLQHGPQKAYRIMKEQNK